MNWFKRKAIGLAVAAAGLAAGSAHAGQVSVDVSGIFSNDELGSLINETRSVYVWQWAQIVGVSWEVVLFADSPSFLSEMSVDMGNGAVTLTPGFDDTVPGSGAYTGSVDLVGLGLDFGLDSFGNLRLEFFESFDDFPNDWDGEWQRGTLRIDFVPEPGTYGLAALALLGLGVNARRRQGNAAV